MVLESDIQKDMQVRITRGRLSADESETLIGPVDTEITVSYVVVTTNAEQGTDFILEDGAVVFNNGETAKNISISVSNRNVLFFTTYFATV